MKTEDIKKMAQAWQQVQEASKLDPVNPNELKGTHAQRKDKDIDNDGDVDKSDEYLHNRRKTIKHAMKKEEVELDEAGPKMKDDYVKTQRAKDKEHADAMGRHVKSGRNKTMTSTQRSLASMRNEEVELDEDISKMPHSRLKWHMNTGVPHGRYTKDEMKKERDRRLKTGEGEAYRKAKPMLEEVDQIDEISKKTLGSYVKKASSDLANNAYKLGARDPLKTPGSWDKAFKRKTGIAKATDRLTKEEAEGLDEISRDTARSYIRKAMAHKTTGETPKKDRSAGVELAGKKAYGMTGKAKVNATEAADLNAANADKAMRHDCATHVEHAEWGKGQPIKGEHTIVETADGEGYVTHYDVMFEHGIEKNVAVEDLKILASESHMHANKRKKMKESNEWPVYARILENRAQHTKGATAAEPIDSKASQGEKDFVAKHGGLDGNDSGIDGAKAAEATAKAATAGVKTAPKRPADATIGDKTMPKA